MSSNDQQVFVSGTWRADRAAEYADAAATVGALIAEAGYSLACGPGTGIARHAVDGFRSVASRRGKVRYHLPARVHMEAVGEPVEDGYDEIVDTEYDYPMRNVFQISRSSGLIAITGGDGTLEEILPALIDYELPVAVLKGSGQASAAIEVLLGIFPEWQANVLIGDDPAELAKFVLERIATR